MLIGATFFKGVKMKLIHFLEYRLALVVLSAVVLLFCDIYRFMVLESFTNYLGHILATVAYIYGVIIAILADFHTSLTKTFRLLVLLFLVTQTVWNVYDALFVKQDIPLITIERNTLFLNSVERHAYCQVLFLLLAQLVSFMTDPSHTKFFLVQRRCERSKLLYLVNFKAHGCVFWERLLLS